MLLELPVTFHCAKGDPLAVASSTHTNVLPVSETVDK